MAKIIFQWCTEVNFDFFLTLCLGSMYISFVKHTPCCTAHKKLFFLCEVFQYVVIVGVCISNKNCHRKGSNEVLLHVWAQDKPLYLNYGYFELFFNTFWSICFDSLHFPDILLSKQFMGFITYVILSYCFLCLFWLFWAYCFWLPCFDACIFYLMPCFDACIFFPHILLSEQILGFTTFIILSNCFLLYVM